MYRSDFETKLSGIIYSNSDDYEKFKALIAFFEKSPEVFHKSSSILLKYKNYIPLLMDDGQCHRGIAFIYPDPDVRLLGNLLRSRIVRPKCLELACILKCKDIRTATFDELEIRNVLSAEDVEDLLNDCIKYGHVILQRCLVKGLISDRVIQKTNLSARLKIKQEKKTESDKKSISSSEQLLSLEARLHDTEKELLETKKQLEIAQSELQKQQEFSHGNTQSGSFHPSNDFDYMSLCIIYIDSFSKIRIKRLADIIDDTISKEFIKDSASYCYFYNKDGPTDEGRIGVWDWKVTPNWNNPEKDIFLTSFRKDIIPIEILCLEDCRSVEDVVSALKVGVAVKPHSAKMLFVYHFGKYLEGVLCYASDLEQNNGKVTILSGVLDLPVYQIGLNDVLYFEKFSVYKAFDLQRNVGTIKVNDPLVIVKDILSRRISWNVMRQRGLTRDQYKKLRDYIVELPTVELYAEIAAACNCSEDDAKVLLEAFIEKADAYISLSTSEAEIMTDVIRNNDALYNSCLEVIRQRWERDNASQIQQAQSNLSKIKQEAEEYRRIVDERKTELLRLQESISDAKRDMESQEQLAEEVRERITAKMEDARTNAAEFLAQQALTFPGFSFTQSNNSNIPFIASSEVPDDDPEHYDSWEDLIELIEYEFVEAGVGKQFSRGLASVLYAAFINKTPVLLAGPYGEEIAKAFSAALCASTPASIKCGGEFSMEAMELCRKSETNVILIMNPFEAAWYHEVLKLISLREKFYILTHPFKEDLVIEPDSLFNYCMPIITDTVIDSVPRGKYLAGLPSEKYTPFAEIKNGNPYNNLWNKFRVGQLAKRQMQTIIDMIHRIDSSSRKSFDFIPILSYAYVTEQTDILTEYINSLGNEKKPSPEVLEQISRLVGEE